MDYIKAIELKLNKTIKKNFLPMQPGDVAATYADTSDLENELGYKPNTDIKEGISNFIDWYIEFYKTKEN